MKNALTFPVRNRPRITKSSPAVHPNIAITSYGTDGAASAKCFSVLSVWHAAPAKAYRFSASDKRILRKNDDLRIVVRRPGMTKNHLELFLTYHHHMHRKRGWEEQPVTPRNYYSSFVHGFNDFGYEVLYFDDDRLIGVDLIDILPSGISSIYFYYDPDYSRRSLGKYSLLKQIQMAKEEGLPWIYLGYYVQGCQSLEYKRSYQPLWQLQGRPAEDESPEWRPLS